MYNMQKYQFGHIHHNTRLVHVDHTYWQY